MSNLIFARGASMKMKGLTARRVSVSRRNIAGIFAASAMLRNVFQYSFTLFARLHMQRVAFCAPRDLL